MTRSRLMDARPRSPAKFNLDGNDVHLGGMWFSVPHRGKSVGMEDDLYFEFVLRQAEERGIEILIADVPGPGPSGANVRFTLHGRFFLRRGDARFGYALVKRVVEELGGTVKRSEVSRVDIALDLPEVAVTVFLDAYWNGRYITKARSKSVVQSEGTTIYFGKDDSPARCAIYDKLCEARVKGTLELMRMRRWGEVIPSCATRVEFRARRQAMKRQGIDQVEDLFAREGDLIEYLTTKWLRFTDGPVDREHNNQQRAVTLPLWTGIQEAFVKGVGGLSGLPLAPVPKAPVSVSHLAKQLVGVIFRGAKDLKRPLPDISAFNLFAIELMEPYAESRLPYQPPT